MHGRWAVTRNRFAHSRTNDLPHIFTLRIQARVERRASTRRPSRPLRVGSSSALTWRLGHRPESRHDFQGPPRRTHPLNFVKTVFVARPRSTSAPKSPPPQQGRASQSSSKLIRIPRAYACLRRRRVRAPRPTRPARAALGVGAATTLLRSWNSWSARTPLPVPTKVL